jgi:hypothetical protein
MSGINLRQFSQLFLRPAASIACLGNRGQVRFTGETYEA